MLVMNEILITITDIFINLLLFNNFRLYIIVTTSVTVAPFNVLLRLVGFLIACVAGV